MVSWLIAMRGNDNSLSSNAGFVALMRLVDHDNQIRAQVRFLIKLPSFQRYSLIGTIAHEMLMQGCLPEDVSAIQALADDDVVLGIRSVIADR